MANLLKSNYDETFNVVQLGEINKGDEFIIHRGGKDRVFVISKVHDQRKERGQYLDESDRRNWARVSAEPKPVL